jgi:hypothetical protein
VNRVQDAHKGTLQAVQVVDCIQNRGRNYFKSTVTVLAKMLRVIATLIYVSLQVISLIDDSNSKQIIANL